jgi:hypothetical protein
VGPLAAGDVSVAELREDGRPAALARLTLRCRAAA